MRIFALLAGLLTMGFAMATTPPKSSPPVTPLQAVMAAAETSGFSGVVLVGDEKATLFEQSIGTADRARRVAHAADMPWRWASVSKQVTAIIAAQLVAEGKLSLDRSVSAYLTMREFPLASARDVTVRHLLQHTAGLANPSDTPSDAPTDAPSDEVPTFYLADPQPELVHKLAAGGACAATPKRAAGSAFEYNNCDTLVLGAIIEKITGQPMSSVLADRIARPLGFAPANRGGLRLATVKDKYAQPVKGYEDGKRLERVLNLATYGAAGALLGTPRELLQLDQALLRGELMPIAERAVFWKGEPKLGYAALGVWSFPASLKSCKEPVELIERRGAIGGIQVRNFLVPSKSRAVVVFTNHGNWEFGEVWQGKGFSHDLLDAVLCRG